MSAHELHEIRVIADLALAANSDQLLVSQRQFVDVLLDLRSVAVSPVMRSTIDERLRDIRFVTMIDASEVPFMSCTRKPTVGATAIRVA